MSCELLVKAKVDPSWYQPGDTEDTVRRDYAHSGTWTRGEIVGVFEVGHNWGAKEAPPYFYRVTVTDRTVEQAQAFLDSWEMDPVLSVSASQPSTDSYRIRLTITKVSQSGRGAITAQKIENFVTGWGGTVHQVNGDGKWFEFDLSVKDAIMSSNFWGRDPSALGMVEHEYNQAENYHDIEITTPGDLTTEQVTGAVEQRGGEMIGPFRFKLGRDDVRNELQDDIMQRMAAIAERRRVYYFTEQGMTLIKNAGGIVSGTASQVLNHLRSGLDD